jgi:flagellar L-ring protein precursor FlgH
MMPVGPRRLALLLAAFALTACADRLENVGKPPAITPPGAPETAVGPLASARAALARRAPAAPPEDYASGSLWRSGPSSLFGDRRARTVGDILTVVIEIDDQATFENQSSRQRAGSEDTSVSALLGVDGLIEDLLPNDATLNPAVGLGSTSSSSGSGTTDRSEEITLRVAATVTDMLPNGHLVIYGSQELRVNFELRDLQVAGVIRPEDISRKNEITLDKIADARLAYGGRGQITDMQQPRYGQQVIDVVMPW